MPAASLRLVTNYHHLALFLLQLRRAINRGIQSQGTTGFPSLGGDHRRCSAQWDGPRQPPIRPAHANNPHLVLRQRASLVRTNHRRGADRLAGDQLTDQAIGPLIFRIARASDTVTLIGNPSGTATTMMITIVMNASSSSPATARACSLAARMSDGALHDAAKQGHKDQRRRDVADPADHGRQLRELLLQRRPNSLEIVSLRSLTRFSSFSPSASASSSSPSSAESLRAI